MQKMDDTNRTLTAIHALKAAKPDLKSGLKTLLPSAAIVRYVPLQQPLL